MARPLRDYATDVYYAFNKCDAPDYYFPFKYQRRYNGEVVGDTVVYCKHAGDFVKLIRHWNSLDSRWLYVLV